MLTVETHLIFMLLTILLSALLLTNALEHLGHRLGISAGVIGSLFAAVATALPETTIPVIALLTGTADIATRQDVSVGAILGAPFMLSTLSIALMALFALSKRGFQGRITPEHTGFVRDLDFFLLAFLISAIAMYLPHQPFYFRGTLSIFLVVWYGIYLFKTVRASKKLVHEGHGVLPEGPLVLARLVGTLRFAHPTNANDHYRYATTMIGIQLALSVLLLLWGARGFVQNIETIANYYHLSVLMLSLLIIPIATELPEKINSILWITKRKDTLAFGNLTGALVFQGTLLPALGVLLTPWEATPAVIPGIALSWLAALWLRLNASTQGVRIIALFVNGLLYVLYCIYSWW